jgi:hypothetical protein
MTRYQVRTVIASAAITLQFVVQTDALHAQQGSAITATLSDRFPVGCTPDQFAPTFCRKGTAGRQLLIVPLGKGFPVDKETLAQVYVTADDSSKAPVAITNYEMGVGVTLVFAVDPSADGFTLIWPGKEPIELTLEREG